MRLLSFGTTKVSKLGKGEYETKSVATKRTYCFDNNDTLGNFMIAMMCLSMSLIISAIIMTC